MKEDESRGDTDCFRNVLWDFSSVGQRVELERLPVYKLVWGNKMKFKRKRYVVISVAWVESNVR